MGTGANTMALRRPSATLEKKGTSRTRSREHANGANGWISRASEQPFRTKNTPRASAPAPRYRNKGSFVFRKSVGPFPGAASRARTRGRWKLRRRTQSARTDGPPARMAGSQRREAANAKAGEPRRRFPPPSVMTVAKPVRARTLSNFSRGSKSASRHVSLPHGPQRRHSLMKRAKDVERAGTYSA